MKKLFKKVFLVPLREQEPNPNEDKTGKSTPDLAKQLADLQAQIAQLKNDKNRKEDLHADVLKEAAAQKAREEERANMQRAIKFNLGIDKFVSDNNGFLTEITANIVQKINEKQFADEEKKARFLQKSLLEDFFSQQKNIDDAPEELKPRILAFKALADDDKEKQAPTYWDTLLLTVDRKKLTAQVEAAKRANGGGYTETNDLIKDYNAKVFARKAQYLGKGE